MTQKIQLYFGNDTEAFHALQEWLQKQSGLVLSRVADSSGTSYGDETRAAGDAKDSRAAEIWARCKTGWIATASGLGAVASLVTLFSFFSENPPDPDQIDRTTLVSDAKTLLKHMAEMKSDKDFTLKLVSTKNSQVLTISSHTSAADIVKYCLDQIDPETPD